MIRKKRTRTEDDDNGFAAWGGYMEAKKSKLLDQYKDLACIQSNKQSNLFHGISIFVNGYTSPSADDLKRLMSLHGGIFHHYHLPSKTTYMIASNLPDTKIKNMGPNQKILKPNWITDSIEAGKLLDYSNYLLYTNQNRRQPRLPFEKIGKDNSINNEINLCDLVQIKEFVDCTTPLSPDMFASFEEDEQTNNINEYVQKEVNNIEKTVLNETGQNDGNIKSSAVGNITNFIPDATKDITNNRIKTANDPKFLSEFYNNSRLHHIATLGATFKQHVCNLREQSNGIFPERDQFKEHLKTVNSDKSMSQSFKGSVIMHIDMDCFFVSVGLRKRPELRGVPVAVTHSKGGQEPSHRSGVDRQAELEIYKQRIQDKIKPKGVNNLGPGNMLVRLEGIENSSMSEIASCSYEARKAGVKNGMFMGTALKLCPNLQTMPYDFKGYTEVAYSLYNTISEYTLNIEAVSCDEMFVDITDLLKDTGATVNEWASYVRSLIQERTGCPCSTGFGANRLQARMATRTAKPNGQFHLLPVAVEEYMVDINVNDLPGVGRSTTLKLTSFGTNTCGDLQQMSMGQLKSEFGAKVGETLYQHSRGIDNRSLVYEHERKSVSAEVNYGIRFANQTEAETFFKQLATEVHSRLMEIKMKGKCITLKLMVRSKDAPVESSKFMGHGICDYINKSTTLSVATGDLDIITREVLLLVQKLSVPPSNLRGIGIQISRLEKLAKGTKVNALSKFLNVNKNNTIINLPAKPEKKELIEEICNHKIGLEDVKLKDLRTNQTTIKAFSKLLNTNNVTNTSAIDEMKNSEKFEENINTKTIVNTTVKHNPIFRIVNKNNVLDLPSTSIGLVESKNVYKNGESNARQLSRHKSWTNNEATSNDRNKEQHFGGREKTVVNNQTHSFGKRGRGRPRGKGNRTIVRKNSNNSNLDKFLTPQNNIQEPIQHADIDMEVLAALPEDIRAEVIQQYQLNNQNNTDLVSTTNQTSNTNHEIKNKPSNSPTDFTHDNNRNKMIVVDDEITSKIGEEPIKTKQQNPCMLSSMNIKQLKKLIEVWISSENSPEICDVKMLGVYFKQLALDRKINDLFMILKYLYSEILYKNSCGWHRAYYEVVNTAQEGMVSKYGSTIWNYKHFQCDNNCHLHNG